LAEPSEPRAGRSVAGIPRRRARRRLVATAAVLAGGALALAAGAGTAVGAHHRSQAAATRPNIVVILSDDQTVASVATQGHVVDQIGHAGATFANNFVNYSLCCPSRATFLTGLYAHNHHVLGNAPPKGGFDRFERLDAGNDLPLWLLGAGYRTGAIGKYLNGYGLTNPTLVPPGWSQWDVVAGIVNYYDYQLNENGTLVGFGSDPSSYVDDVITGKAVDFIDRNAPRRRPFFLYVGYKAPHGGGPHPTGSRCANGPPEPPPRHFGQFAGTPLPEPPNFNEADVSDKPRFVQNSPLLTPQRIAAEQTLYQCELESLQGVNDGVNQIMRALRSSGELKNTYVIYTSDNGFFHGEHRIYTGKVKVYEPSIRVPLLMRGPGIRHGVTVKDLTINADLAPTIVDLAHADADRVMNGISLLSDLEHPDQELGRRLLIEGNNFHAIRTARYKFVQYDDGEQELYDEQLDPYELQNQIANPAYAPVAAILSEELSHLRDCVRAGCRRPPHIKLRLHYRRSTSPAGTACSRGPVTVSLEGRNANLLVEADFTVAGTAAGALHAPPFQIVVPLSELGTGRQHVRVHALANLLDGRELTLGTTLPPRCG
jgi:N-acetylglucosamine-6-sulfatase